MLLHPGAVPGAGLRHPGRPGTPEEVATVIAFLAMPAASHIVGEMTEVNGGRLML
ncbi:hypothetical protein LIP_2004 [Limnochorda pilosa]|uniref:Short-chain dehydrogenase n=1 Tax=Limnochorda pilosa TaxID=1555112 RepID=A0A0K2SL67_LIMPI|nr:hypothetical protein LIP_2004 [Limnochorda pilosa]